MEYTLSWVYDKAKLNGRVIIYAFILLVGLVIEAWEMTVVGFLMPDITKEFGLNAGQAGIMASALYIGMLVGSYIWGPFGEKKGRRLTFSLGLVGYGVFTIICALSRGYDLFLFLRFMSGLMFAALAVVIFPYYEELVPTKLRGILTPLLSAGWPVGTIAAAILSRSVIPTLGWRSALIISGIVGMWGIISYLVVPESPFWLAAKGREIEARSVVINLFPEMLEYQDDLLCKVETQGVQGSVFELFRPEFRKLTLEVFVVNFVYAWAYWGLFLWLPSMLMKQGLSFLGSADFMIIATLFQIPGYLAAALLSRRVGRKHSLIPFALGGALFGVLFALAKNSGTALWMFALMSFFNLGGWGVWNTWMSELFPTLIRNTGTGWGIASQKWATIVAPIINGYLVAAGVGLPVLVGIAVAFLIITASASATFKETEGVSLA